MQYLEFCADQTKYHEQPSLPFLPNWIKFLVGVAGKVLGSTRLSRAYRGQEGSHRDMRFQMLIFSATAKIIHQFEAIIDDHQLIVELTPRQGLFYKEAVVLVIVNH